jgi:chromosome segregation ATPase
MPHRAAHDQVDELRRRVADENQKLRQAQVELEAAKGRADDLSRALTSAYADEDQELVEEYREELQRAEAAVADLEHRVAGAELRAAAVRGELDGFLAESAQALLEEREPLARELAAELSAAVDQVVRANGKYRAERQHIDGLVAKVPGAEPRLDGISTSYAWEPELRALERAYRTNPSADVPAPRWSGRAHIANLNETHRKLREGRREERAIG